MIRVSDGKISSITSVGSSKEGEELDGYELEPHLVTALFEGENRTEEPAGRSSPNCPR